MAKRTTAIKVPEAVPATAADVPDEFPVSLDDFVGSLPLRYVGMRGAFKHAARNVEGRKTATEWQKMLDTFANAPVGTQLTK